MEQRYRREEEGIGTKEERGGAKETKREVADEM
jgi:hypothetical protein